MENINIQKTVLKAKTNQGNIENQLFSIFKNKISRFFRKNANVLNIMGSSNKHIF